MTSTLFHPDPTNRDCPTMSSFLRNAVGKARGLDRDFYSPNAKYWHTPIFESDGRLGCVVCFSGALLANLVPPDIKVEDTHAMRDFDIPLPLLHRIIALDFLRVGDLITAVCHMSLLSPLTTSQRAKLVGLQTEIDTSPFIRNQSFVGWKSFDQFLGSMDTLAGRLEAIGI